MVERLSRPLYRIVLRALRPAEAAVRRLIIVMARDIVVKPRPKRPFPTGRVIARKGSRRRPRPRRAVLQIVRPAKAVSTGSMAAAGSGRKIEPRIHVLDGFDPRIPWFLRSQSTPAAPAPKENETIDDDTVNAGALCRRLFAIMRALEDLPRQARRLALWRSRPIEERRPRRETPLQARLAAGLAHQVNPRGR